MYFFKLKTVNSYSDYTRLHYVAFLKPENNALVTKIFFKSRRNGVYLNETKTDQAFIKEAIKSIIHKDRKRINRRY